MDDQIAWPVKCRELNSIPVDSRRWNDFAFRDDDIVIATWAKSGTTWTQQIVAQLVLGGDPEVYGQGISPWIDGVPIPEPLAREMAEAQTHRRFLKTHLPIDALVYSPRAKYLYVGRDARDVFWSWHHHWSILTPEIIALLNAQCANPLSRDVPEISTAYHQWLDDDAFPQTSFWDHVQGWWDCRHLPNLMLLHFAELKADPAAVIRRIAAWLDIPADDVLVEKVVAYSTADHMRELAARHEGLAMMFEGGGRAFINQGTNNRWRDVLNADEIAKADRIAAERLSPECAHWLRTGEMPN